MNTPSRPSRAAVREPHTGDRHARKGTAPGVVCVTEDMVVQKMTTEDHAHLEEYARVARNDGIDLLDKERLARELVRKLEALPQVHLWLATILLQRDHADEVERGGAVNEEALDLIERAICRAARCVVRSDPRRVQLSRAHGALFGAEPAGSYYDIDGVYTAADVEQCLTTAVTVLRDYTLCFASAKGWGAITPEKLDALEAVVRDVPGYYPASDWVVDESRGPTGDGATGDGATGGPPPATPAADDKLEAALALTKLSLEG